MANENRLVVPDKAGTPSHSVARAWPLTWCRQAPASEARCRGALPKACRR